MRSRQSRGLLRTANTRRTNAIIAFRFRRAITKINLCSSINIVTQPLPVPRAMMAIGTATRPLVILIERVSLGSTPRRMIGTELNLGYLCDTLSTRGGPCSLPCLPTLYLFSANVCKLPHIFLEKFWKCCDIRITLTSRNHL